MTSARSASASTSCCFSGVLYHLRHPLLALDLIREHVARDLFVCQSMQRGDPGEEPIAEDYPFTETAVFERPAYPHMSFHRAPLCRRRHELVGAEPGLHEGDAAQRRFRHRQQSGGGSLRLPAGSAALWQGRGLSGIAARGVRGVAA